MDGCRTHRGPQGGPPPILKTGKPTGAYPLPGLSIPHRKWLVNRSSQCLFWDFEKREKLLAQINETFYEPSYLAL